jgi:hypothetical protein
MEHSSEGFNHSPSTARNPRGQVEREALAMVANVHASIGCSMHEQPLAYDAHLVSWRWRLRRMFCFPAALCGALAVTIYVVARKGLNDPDIWWHLRNAEYLIQERRWLRADIYSYTVFGHPWVNHEWLAEIPYYIAWRSFGEVGIKALSLLLLATIFGGVLYLCWWKSRNIKAAAAACLLAVFLGSVSFGPRTILFGYVYLVILLLILERVRAGASAPLWLLPLLFCLWANTHGSWALGAFVLLIFIGCGLVEGQCHSVVARRWSSSQLRRLCVAAGASMAGVFINPYGYRLAFYPLDMAFRQSLNISHVAEWSSVDFHDTRGQIALLSVIGLLLGALLYRRTWQLDEVVLASFGIYASFTHVRFLLLAGILLAPVFANLASWMPGYRPEIDKPLLNALILCGGLAFMIHSFPTNETLHQSIDRDFPEEILPYLRSNPPSGRVLNYYTWGGYLVWRDPTFRDFIDSRVDVFEYGGLLQDYLDLIDLKNVTAVLQKYHVRYVLFPGNEHLSYVLANDPGWKVDYAGNVSILFERVDGAAASVSGNAGEPEVSPSPADRFARGRLTEGPVTHK